MTAKALSSVATFLRSNNGRIRAACYLVIGNHKLVGAVKQVKARLSREKALAREACIWALEELGEDVPGVVGKDPSGSISSLLPTL